MSSETITGYYDEDRTFDRPRHGSCVLRRKTVEDMVNSILEEMDVGGVTVDSAELIREVISKSGYINRTEAEAIINRAVADSGHISAEEAEELISSAVADSGHISAEEAAELISSAVAGSGHISAEEAEELIENSCPTAFYAVCRSGAAELIKVLSAVPEGYTPKVGDIISVRFTNGINVSEGVGNEVKLKINDTEYPLFPVSGDPWDHEYLNAVKAGYTAVFTYMDAAGGSEQRFVFLSAAEPNAPHKRFYHFQCSSDADNTSKRISDASDYVPRDGDIVLIRFDNGVNITQTGEARGQVILNFGGDGEYPLMGVTGDPYDHRYLNVINANGFGVFAYVEPADPDDTPKFAFLSAENPASGSEGGSSGSSGSGIIRVDFISHPSQWVSSGREDFPFKNEIPLSAVTADMNAVIGFEMDSLTATSVIAETADTLDGALRLYGEQRPERSLHGTAFLFKPQEVE